MLVFSYRRVVDDNDDLGGALSMRDRTELQHLVNEVGSVRMMTAGLRAQRHEYANRIHALSGLLEGQHQAEALEYVRNIQIPDIPADDYCDEVIASATVRSFLGAKTTEAAEQRVRLTLSDTSVVPYKVITPLEVITVLGNLVDNAIDAASRSSRRPRAVEVDMIADGFDLLIYVADTGDGVDPERLDIIFTQGHSSRGPGRGFGLATARETARSLSGDVWVASLSNSETTFPGAAFGARLPDVLRSESE